MPTLMDFLTALLHGKFSGKEKEMLEPGTPPHQHWGKTEGLGWFLWSMCECGLGCRVANGAARPGQCPPCLVLGRPSLSVSWTGSDAPCTRVTRPSSYFTVLLWQVYLHNNRRRFNSIPIWSNIPICSRHKILTLWVCDEWKYANSSCFSVLWPKFKLGLETDKVLCPKSELLSLKVCFWMLHHEFLPPSKTSWCSGPRGGNFICEIAIWLVPRLTFSCIRSKTLIATIHSRAGYVRERERAVSPLITQ